jgi:hypothetical protein
MKFNIGDKVIFKKAQINQIEKAGHIVKIEYDPHHSGPFFYRVAGITKTHHANNPRGYISWSCNIFPHLGDVIQLDLVAIRQEKLNQLV